MRRRVATVQEGMHAAPWRTPRARGELDHRRDLPLVAVHAARRDEAQHVQRAAATARLPTTAASSTGLRRELAGRDSVIDAREVLVDDASRADVEMPDLGVAHLPARQSDGKLGRVDRRVRDASREARRQFGMRALAIALSGAGSRLPKPSRMTRTTGRTSGRASAAWAAAG